MLNLKKVIRSEGRCENVGITTNNKGDETRFNTERSLVGCVKETIGEASLSDVVILIDRSIPIGGMTN